MSTENGSHNGAAGNGHLIDDGKVRVAIVGVGNCANSLIQGVTYYKDADPAEQVPGLMHVDLGGYHVRDIEFVAAFDIDSEKVGKDLWRGDLVGPEQHDQVRRRPRARGPGPSRHDPRRPRQVPEGEDHQGSGADRRRGRDPQGDQGRRPGLLPAGRLRAGDQVVRRAGAPGRGRVRQLPARLHRPRGLLGPPLRGARAADHRRRHQVAGRARPSSTASSRGCSTTAACGSSAPRSSTSGATWTSTTCSSASGWPRRRSRRQTPSPRSWATICRLTAFTSVRPTTCPGSPIASGPTSGSRATPSATSR